MMEGTCPTCGMVLSFLPTDTVGTCPNCGAVLEVTLQENDYWALFAMWLLGIITGASAVVGGATLVGYKLVKGYVR